MADPAKMAPYDFYQYWINVDDTLVAQYLALFTFLPMEEIRDLTARRRRPAPGQGAPGL